MAQAGLNYEKTGGQKSRWTVPLKIKLCLKGDYRDPSGPVNNWLKYFWFWLRLHWVIQTLSVPIRKYLDPLLKSPYCMGFAVIYIYNYECAFHCKIDICKKELVKLPIHARLESRVG